MARRETGEGGPGRGDQPGGRGADPMDGAEAQEAALRAELKRLRDLGEGLRRLSAEAAKVRDPETLARLQDQNLAAFEAMVTAQGLDALDRMRGVVARLREGGTPFPAAAPPAGPEQGGSRSDRNGPDAGATGRGGPGQAMDEALAEAQLAIRSARKRETEKLLGRIGERFRAAQEKAANDNKNKTKDTEEQDEC